MIQRAKVRVLRGCVLYGCAYFELEVTDLDTGATEIVTASRSDPDLDYVSTHRELFGLAKDAAVMVANEAPGRVPTPPEVAAFAAAESNPRLQVPVATGFEITFDPVPTE